MHDFGARRNDSLDDDVKKLVGPDCVGEVAYDDIKELLGPTFV